MHSRLTTHSLAIAVVLVAIVASAGGTFAVTAAASTPPPVTMSAAPGFPSGQFYEAEGIAASTGTAPGVTVSVPAGFFPPNAAIRIIECGDPGGLVQNLPKSVLGCDGNTIQSIVSGENGSVLDKRYILFSLPNYRYLQESKDSQPTCNLQHECVLYVGVNQEDFTQLKLWSTPFAINPTPYSGPYVAASTGSSVSPLVWVLPVALVVVLAALAVALTQRRRRASAAA